MIAKATTTSGEKGERRGGVRENVKGVSSF
jgi:hypothetical protein